MGNAGEHRLRRHSRFGAGVVSGGGGPAPFRTGLKGIGVCSIRSTKGNAALATFFDLQILGVRGAVSTPSATASRSPCFLVRFTLVFSCATGICEQCVGSTPGFTFSFPTRWTKPMECNRLCTCPPQHTFRMHILPPLQL